MRSVHILTGIIMISFITALLGACSKDLKLPDIKNGEKIVLLGELVAGDSIYIRAGQSIPLSSSSSLSYKQLNGLSITVKDQTGMSWPLSFLEDYLFDQLHTDAYVAALKIAAGQTYQLTARASLGTVTANCAVPAAFTAVIKDTATLIYGNDTVMRFDVEINDPAGDNAYVIEALKQRMVVYGYFFFEEQWLDIPSFKPTYDSLINAGISVSTKFDTFFQEGFVRQDIYTGDPNTENHLNGGQYTVCRRVLLKDKAFDGHSYITQVFVSKRKFRATEDLDKGRIFLRVRAVAADYFTFLKGYGQYEPVTGLGVNQLPVKIAGNVSGGLGMIGGVYQNQFIYIFDRWQF